MTKALVTNANSNGTPLNTEPIIMTNKENEVWVRAKGETDIVNGKCVRISRTFQDINEKKKAELKYRETSERIRIATKIASIATWEYNIERKKLIWDANMYPLYRISEESLSGVYKAWEATIYPDDKQSETEGIAPAILGKKEFTTEFCMMWTYCTVRFIKAIAKTEKKRKRHRAKLFGKYTNFNKHKEAQSIGFFLQRTKKSL